MSKPSNRPRTRAFSPLPEQLEGRQLLAKTVSGIDIDGDKWTLQLQGPGDLNVVNQTDSAGNVIPFTQPAEINSITVAGADPLSTKLIGRVTKATGGDGQVFFNNFTELGGRSESEPGANGIRVIDMPDFFVGSTFPSTVASTSIVAPSITIPDGVITLRFGGADAERNIPAGSTTANPIAINLGLPFTIGTSIIVDRILSGTRPNPTAGSPAFQDGVTFTVSGRINLFQANEIDGDPANPSTGFGASSSVFGTPSGGGTIVVSAADALTATTGQIGYVRIGGNATNFSVQTNDKISNYYIGGEASNVFLLAPGGARNLYFGKGVDTANIQTHTIDTLQANRDMTNSTISTDRGLGRILIGGDVSNSTVLSGYALQLSSVFSNQAALTTPAPAEDGGGMTVLVAGSINNSVFAASVQPSNGFFGTPNDLVIPHSHINAKVEGTINNATATPASPNKAFYAQQVHLSHGPVIPPTVPEAPFAAPVPLHRGQQGLAGPSPFAVPTPTKKVGAIVPKGPASKSAKA